MNFVAIDFETANEKRNSPCSLGLTVVKNNQIVEEKYWLIRPKELRFAPMNIMVHGMREGDVKNEKEWDALWPEILPYLRDNLVVCHNAAFDISVLRSTLDTYELPYPSFDYCCTLIMSRHFFPYLENAKLSTVNKHLGYHFNHHHASSDASACANILLSISEELNTRCAQTLAKQVGVKIGKLYAGGYTPASSNGGGLCSQRKNTYLAPTPPAAIQETDAFKGHLVAFTGPLQSMARHQAIAIVERLGGDYTPSVTLKTTRVITNVKDPFSLSFDQMSTKMRRAMTLIERGQKIEFMTEAQFLALTQA